MTHLKEALFELHCVGFVRALSKQDRCSRAPGVGPLWCLAVPGCGRLPEPLVLNRACGNRRPGPERAAAGGALQRSHSSLFVEAGKETFRISPGKHGVAVPQLPGPDFCHKCQVHLRDTQDEFGRGGGEGLHVAKQLL